MLSDVLFVGRLYDPYTPWYPSLGIDRVVLSSGHMTDGVTTFVIQETDSIEDPENINVRFETGLLNYPWIDDQGNPRPYGDGFLREWTPAYPYFRLSVGSTGSYVELSLRAIPY